MEQGEKVTKYFCNLEKRNYVCKAMPNLYKSDGTKTTNENEIRCHVKEFYKKLYTLRQVKNSNLNEKLDWSKIIILTDTLRDSLEGPINNEEALNALKSMKNNKSPGSDGFSSEFFNLFGMIWANIL